MKDCSTMITWRKWTVKCWQCKPL